MPDATATLRDPSYLRRCADNLAADIRDTAEEIAALTRTFEDLAPLASDEKTADLDAAAVALLEASDRLGRCAGVGEAVSLRRVMAGTAAALTAVAAGGDATSGPFDV